MEPTEWIVFAIVAGAVIFLIVRKLKKKKDGCCDQACEPLKSKKPDLDA